MIPLSSLFTPIIPGIAAYLHPLLHPYRLTYKLNKYKNNNNNNNNKNNNSNGRRCKGALSLPISP